MISGTSHDGIDVALVDFAPTGDTLTGVVEHTATTPYPPALRARLVKALPPAATTLAEVCELDTLIGQSFAQAAATAIQQAGPVDLIVSHGQTVYHWVEGAHALGTLQIGQPAWIAERTRTPVLSDVRIRDITAGGHGAPLVSLLDALLLAAHPSTAAALNLGGISNMTVVRGPDDLVAYDIGPAGALVDAVVTSRGLNPRGFDEDGRIAAAGTLDQRLLDVLLDDPYYRLPAPKSTGKEHFNLAYLDDVIAKAGLRPGDADLVATLTELTVRTVAREVTAAGADLLVASGGGSRNPVLMDGLRRALPGVTVTFSDAYGAPADDKEAIAFALIGWHTMHGLPGAVPAGTGARAPRMLGTLTPGGGPLTLPAARTEPPRALTLTRRRPEGHDITLRPATLADLDGVVEVFLACWHRSYTGVMPASLVAAMTPGRARELWARVLAESGPSEIVAVRSGGDAPSVLGITRYGLDEHGDGTVYSLYVHPDAQGGGLGARLLRGAQDALATAGASRASLWVFADNAPSIGFYRSQGWAPDGTTRVQAEFGEPELRLVKTLHPGRRT
ncbi:anhydro-N-acetylmuramic acid kinase [Sphaerisporangium fuscum]|uniref:anhydro-N-acetylmuramic acid kinase n=1 Tax=Sphaerisporangium fuscum TaxID=2835868 RepID=UPI002029B119|nr:anhydro-N-acetylmuramic acid kinase [Sphaerisporangium fuscum]